MKTEKIKIRTNEVVNAFQKKKTQTKIQAQNFVAKIKTKVIQKSGYEEE